VHALLNSFLFTTWGVCVVAALDTTLVFFLPFAVDLGVVFLSARNPEFFWAYAILISGMSLVGASVTFYIGYRIGEKELERFISAKKARKVIAKVQKKGAIALAALDLIPPPFPFTAFALTAGALEVNAVRFFVAMFAFRMLRFGVEAALAARFGSGVIHLIESPTWYIVGEVFTAVILTGSAISIYVFAKHLNRRPADSQTRAA
jgi:membrane protein YqaA with SNARE-associated domain